MSSFQPYFKIYERGHGEAAIKLEISTLLIREMIEKGAFQLEPVNIPVSNQLGTTTVALYLLDKKTTPPRSSAYPISGFPRSLVRKEQPHRLGKLLSFFNIDAKVWTSFSHDTRTRSA